MKLESLGRAIFNIRFGMVPIYFGLYIAIAVYIVRFYGDIFTFIVAFPHKTNEDILMWVLNLIDISMVGNLVVMTTIGGYSTFVRPLPIIENAPRWMHGLDSNNLKVKTALSLVSVTAIHLLKTFMESPTVPVQQVEIEIAIHLVMIITLLATVLYVYLHEKSHHE